MKTNKIYIDASRLTNRDDMHEYMKEVFEFPEYFGRNLDALYDCLGEIIEDVDVIFTSDALRIICENEYAFRCLMVFGKAADENPFIHLLFRK